MINLQKKNLYKESLLSSKNETILPSNQIQTIETNNFNECNQNQKNNEFNDINHINDINIDEIYNRYIKLKKKINLFWNKVE